MIVGAARTPIGRYLGALSSLSAPQLGGIAIREAVRRAGVEPGRVREVIMGNVLQGGVGQAPARQAMLAGGIPASVSAVTINKVCGSGLKSVMLAAQSIRAGDADVIVAGGMESMSNSPHYVYGYRGGVKFGDQQLVDGMIRDGLWCATCNVHMGSHAEYTAKKAHVSRERQDEFAAESHRRAIAAQDAGKFRNEIVCVEIAGKKGPTMVDADEGPRRDTTVASLAGLKPAFGARGEADLSVTAGNASTLNDGAAAVVVVSEAFAKEHGLTVLARIDTYATGAVEPRELFFAPIRAVGNLLAKEKSKISDFDLIEANEAFASQSLADGDALGWDPATRERERWRDRPWPPDWCQRGARARHAAHALADRGGRRGLATLCLGGGDAVAMSITRP